MDLNTASIPDMAEVVGLETAYDLFLWRPFLSWDEVLMTPGITPEQVDKLRETAAIRLPGELSTGREALDARMNGLDRGRAHDGDTCA